MRNYRSLFASFFILIVKNTQRHQLIANTPLKTFYTLYKMRWNVLKLFYHGSIRHYISKIFVPQNLKLIVTNRYHKRKPKSLKSKDFKKAVVFKRDSPNQ
ncbi:hypothetical protein KVB96_04755 [Helicobacter pylori]|nr:hypothetical protein KVB96_04755 [Helicobacter pylori]